MKYLDSTGLSHFWDKVKSRMASKTDVDDLVTSVAGGYRLYVSFLGAGRFTASGDVSDSAYQVSAYIPVSDGYTSLYVHCEVAGTIGYAFYSMTGANIGFATQTVTDGQMVGVLIPAGASYYRIYASTAMVDKVSIAYHRALG